MGFSEEWNEIYKNNEQLSIWPWSDLISLVKRYVKYNGEIKILELGCGAGANIPFLASLDNASYYAIEGSEHIVKQLNEKYEKYKNVNIVCGDFTKSIPFQHEFDLIVDRSSITHNTTSNIIKTISLVYERLKKGGIFIGIDWHSTCYSNFLEDIEKYENLDEKTRIYKTGNFGGVGITHFSDEHHIIDLLKKFKIKVLYEKKYIYSEPVRETRGTWNFVAVKD